MRPRHDFVAKTQVGLCSVFRLIPIKIPNHNPKLEAFSTTSLNEKNRSIFLRIDCGTTLHFERVSIILYAIGRQTLS